MHADSQRQCVIGSMAYFKFRVRRAQQAQSQVGDFPHVTVPIAARKPARHHIRVSDRFHLSQRHLYETQPLKSLLWQPVYISKIWIMCYTLIHMYYTFMKNYFEDSLIENDSFAPIERRYTLTALVFSRYSCKTRTLYTSYLSMMASNSV